VGNPSARLQKVNWDVAIDREKGHLGMGAIVRDHEGHVLAAKSFTKLGIQEPVATEALAALHATKFSQDLGLQIIILESNTLQVVNAVKSTGRNWSKYGQLVEDTRGVFNMLHSW
jgi:hypothetical protein